MTVHNLSLIVVYLLSFTPRDAIGGLCQELNSCVDSIPISENQSINCQGLSNIFVDYCRKNKTSAMEQDCKDTSTNCYIPINFNESDCYKSIKVQCIINSGNNRNVKIHISNVTAPVFCDEGNDDVIYMLLLNQNHNSLNLSVIPCKVSAGNPVGSENDSILNETSSTVSANTGGTIESSPTNLTIPITTTSTESLSTGKLNITSLTYDSLITESSSDRHSENLTKTSVTTSSTYFTTDQNIWNVTVLDTLKQIESKSDVLIIGLIVALIAVCIILLTLVIIICKIRARRKILFSVKNQKLHLFTQLDEENSTSIHDQKDNLEFSDSPVCEVGVYHETDKTDSEAHQYWEISDRRNDVIPLDCSNLFTTVSDGADLGYEILEGGRRVPSVVATEPSEVAANSGSYFVLDGDGNSPDYGSTGNYFVLEKDTDVNKSVLISISTEDGTHSDTGYSKLGQIKRETDNKNGMASDKENDIISLNLLQAPQQPISDSMFTIASENAALYSLAGNATNSSVGDLPDKIDTPEIHGDHVLNADATANYFELESSYIKTGQNISEDSDDRKSSSS